MMNPFVHISLGSRDDEPRARHRASGEYALSLTRPPEASGYFPLCLSRASPSEAASKTLCFPLRFTSHGMRVAT